MLDDEKKRKKIGVGDEAPGARFYREVTWNM
jgi:hypothetical protein